MLRFINKHKNFLRRLHRWLGLLSGIVVFIVALTGAIYAFEHEINVWLDSGVHRKVAVENKAIISALEVEKVVRQKYEKDIARMSLTVYPAGDEGIICWVMNKERQWTAFIMNPYSGEVIDRYEWAVNFWAVILELHTSLMIPEIGHDIVAISTVIFAIMIFTGFFLWLPPKLKGWKSRLTVKWGAPFKRKNYDIHRAAAIYSSTVVIFMIFTGLSWSYHWFDDTVLGLVGGEYTKHEKEKEFAGKELGEINYESLDATFKKLAEGKYHSYEIRYPAGEKVTYTFTKNYSETGLQARDMYWIKPETGEVLLADTWAEKSLVNKIRNGYYFIHIGAIFGLTGKFIWCIMSLLAASLPITGFIIWKNRKSKNQKTI